MDLALYKTKYTKLRNHHTDPQVILNLMTKMNDMIQKHTLAHAPWSGIIVYVIMITNIFIVILYVTLSKSIFILN